ncbi:MAG: hypothetical protein ACQEXV_22530 [Bacillota bacterium]
MNIMTAAWVIARKSAVKFGGSPKQYFAEALRLAWSNLKAAALKVEWELPTDSRKTRTWMAKIVGTHPVYKLARTFLNPDGTDSYGDKIFRLSDGYYEANNGKRRQYIHVANGDYTIVDAVTVGAAMAVNMSVA